MKKKNYCIKDDYTHRQEYIQNIQINARDKFQDEVYHRARNIVDEHDYGKILDIGCGSSFKLIKYFRDKYFLGLELEPNLSWLRETYPQFNYALSDYQSPPEEHFDLVICSDVIEHLLDPDKLLEFINKLNFKHFVVSTPERNLIQQVQKQMGWHVQENGPPANECHIREWTKPEFAEYVSQIFKIEEHFITHIQKECQVVVATKYNENSFR
jgi:SAM-dependent methyltransferase